MQATQALVTLADQEVSRMSIVSKISPRLNRALAVFLAFKRALSMNSLIIGSSAYFHYKKKSKIRGN